MFWKHIIELIFSKINSLVNGLNLCIALILSIFFEAIIPWLFILLLPFSLDISTTVILFVFMIFVLSISKFTVTISPVLVKLNPFDTILSDTFNVPVFVKSFVLTNPPTLITL